jgi:hypothetical protein
MIVWVKRGELPAWYDLAISANRGNNFALQELKMMKIHASETSWVGTDFDHVVDNDGTINDLFQTVENLIIGDKIALLP